MSEALPFKGVELGKQATRLGIIVASSLLLAKALYAANGRRTTPQVDNNAEHWQELDFTDND